MRRVFKLISYSLLILWSATIVGIGIWIIYSSFKTNVEVFQSPWGLPQSPSLNNYIQAWRNSKMGIYFKNSVIVTGIAVVCNVFFASCAAYALSRFDFKLRYHLISFFIFGMSIPIQLILIPLYSQLRVFDLIATRTGQIFVYMAIWLPFGIYVLTGFFSSIPREMEEAAIIDGCKEIGTFFRIMFPLAQPGLLAVATFSFVGMWNEYLLALCFTSSNQRIKTISLGMLGLKDALTYTSQYAVLFAAIVIMVIPAAIVYSTMRKYVVAGLTLGAVKG